VSAAKTSTALHSPEALFHTCHLQVRWAYSIAVRPAQSRRKRFYCGLSTCAWPLLSWPPLMRSRCGCSDHTFACGLTPQRGIKYILLDSRRNRVSGLCFVTSLGPCVTGAAESLKKTLFPTTLVTESSVHASAQPWDLGGPVPQSGFSASCIHPFGLPRSGACVGRWVLQSSASYVVRHGMLDWRHALDARAMAIAPSMVRYGMSLTPRKKSYLPPSPSTSHTALFSRWTLTRIFGPSLGLCWLRVHFPPWKCPLQGLGAWTRFSLPWVNMIYLIGCTPLPSYISQLSFHSFTFYDSLQGAIILKLLICLSLMWWIYIYAHDSLQVCEVQVHSQSLFRTAVSYLPIDRCKSRLVSSRLHTAWQLLETSTVCYDITWLTSFLVIQ